MNAAPAERRALSALAAAESVDLPYDFAEFRRRSVLHRGPQRLAWRQPARMTGIAATLSAVLLGAALWRYVAVPESQPRPARVDVAAADSGPALVRAGHVAARAELEERIALIDAMLSESRVNGAQGESLRAMEQGRSTLVDSLQRVAYAQQLVEP